MRVGIGVTTYNRPECLAKCLEQIRKNTNMDDVLLYVATDTDADRRGVAYRKNECLRALKDCDHIFLFDDDCYPINDGWVDFFIDSEENHLLFLNESHIKIDNILRFNNVKFKVIPGQSYNFTGITDSVIYGTYKDCGGVFMYMTNKAVQKVGAFNENFDTWGFEHAEYSCRIALAFNEKHPYKCLTNTNKYLFAEDYSNPNHESSISAFEKQKYFDKNIKLFAKPIKNIYLPL